MKIQIQKLNNSKLFYQKWPYKIECTIFGAQLCSRHTINFLKIWCQDKKKTLFNYSYGSKNVNKEELLKFVCALEPFIFDQNIKVRTEVSNCNLFCLDIETVELVEQNLRPWVRKISGPTTQEELDFILENGARSILCDNLPKSGHKFKVYFHNKFPLEQRKSFAQWIETLPDKIIISPTSNRWLKGERLYAQDPFAYVKDEKVLTMVGLHVSNYIKKIEKFVLRSNLDKST